jgi:hypothetical protein
MGYILFFFNLVGNSWSLLMNECYNCCLQSLSLSLSLMHALRVCNFLRKCVLEKSGSFGAVKKKKKKKRTGDLVNSSDLR